VLQSFDSEADGGPSAAIAGNSTKSIEDTLASPIAGQPLVLGPTGGNVAPQAAGLYIMARAPGRPADLRRAALDLRSSARARRRPRRWPPKLACPSACARPRSDRCSPASSRVALGLIALLRRRCRAQPNQYAVSSDRPVSVLICGWADGKWMVDLLRSLVRPRAPARGLRAGRRPRPAAPRRGLRGTGHAPQGLAVRRPVQAMLTVRA